VALPLLGLDRWNPPTVLYLLGGGFFFFFRWPGMSAGVSAMGKFLRPPPSFWPSFCGPAFSSFRPGRRLSRARLTTRPVSVDASAFCLGALGQIDDLLARSTGTIISLAWLRAHRMSSLSEADDPSGSGGRSHPGKDLPKTLILSPAAAGGIAPAPPPPPRPASHGLEEKPDRGPRNCHERPGFRP